MGKFVAGNIFVNSHECSVLKDGTEVSTRLDTKLMGQEPGAWDLGRKYVFSANCHLRGRVMHT